MKIHVRVQPRASKEEIVCEDEGAYKVYVRESATDGKANAAVCRVLAKEFKVPKSRITIVRGEKSRNKLIDIPE